jgi:uncharacterized membrane protein
MTVAIVLSSASSILLLVGGLVLPSINSLTVPFGVRVPAQRAHDPVVRRQTRIYRWRVLASGIVAAAIGVLTYRVTGEALTLMSPVLALVGLWYGCFILANHEIRAAKVAGGWYEGLRQGIAADTELRTDPPRFPWLWLAPALIVIVATVVIGVISYPSVPEMLAMHNNAEGMPDRLTAKSISTAFSLIFVQIGMTVLLVGIAAAIVGSSRPDIDPAHPIGSARWHRQYVSLGAKMLLALVAAVDTGLLGLSLLMWTGTVASWGPLVVVVPILAVVVLAVVVLARSNRARNGGEQDTGLTHRDDDKYWRGGLFYTNREDRALLVPRRFGLGWTLNFGNPQTAILLAGVVALVGLLIALRFGG